MKRLLLLFTLLFAMLALPLGAQAESFVFGAEKDGEMLFDTTLGLNPNNPSSLDVLMNNLNKINSDSNAWLMEARLDHEDFDKSQYFEVTIIGYSDYVDQFKLFMTAEEGRLKASSFGKRTIEAAMLSDIHVDWHDDTINDRDKEYLYNLTTVWQLDGTLTATIGGEEVNFYGGYFFAYKIPGSDTPEGGIDFIIYGRPVDPPVVPVPGAVWLLGSGLAGLFAIRRRAS